MERFLRRMFRYAPHGMRARVPCGCVVEKKHDKEYIGSTQVIVLSPCGIAPGCEVRHHATTGGVKGYLPDIFYYREDGVADLLGAEIRLTSS